MPVPSTEVKLVDDENREVSPGQPGELCVRGPQVMQGYFNRPDESAKVLIDGWLHTGDVAVVDERGFFKIVDRKKDMILVSGFNVYPNEIEDVIARHAKVLEVAVIGVLSESSGEAVKAFVVKRDASLLPTTRYLGLVIEGALEHGLPDPWVRSLRAVPVREETVPIHGIRVGFAPGSRWREVRLEPCGTTLEVTDDGHGPGVTVPRLDVHAMVVAEPAE